MITHPTTLHCLLLASASALFFAGCAHQAKQPEPSVMLRITAISAEEQAEVDHLMQIAAEEVAANNDYVALDYYKDVFSNHPDSPDAPEALYRSAKIRLAHNQFGDAFSCLDKILANYPSYPRFNEVVRDEFEMATQMMEGARPYYFGVIPGFLNYESAVDYFEGVVKKAPFTEYAPLALMNIALIAEKHGKPTDAVDALDRLINTYPKSVLTPDAYLKLANIYADMVQGPAYDQGATKDSIRYYEDFLILFPKSEHIAQAEIGLHKMRDMLAKSKLYMANLYRDRLKDDTAALVFYNETITTAPNSPSADAARLEITGIQTGVPAPGTPIDFLFTERQLSLKEYQEESYVQARSTDIFEPLEDDGLLDTPSQIIESATPLEEALEAQDPLGEQTNKPQAKTLEESLEDLPVAPASK